MLIQRPAQPHNLIASRDGDGNAHWLFVVDHPDGEISLTDGSMIRMMSPRDASLLVLALVHALGACLPTKN